jgi:hypothetical protein
MITSKAQFKIQYSKYTKRELKNFGNFLKLTVQNNVHKIAYFLNICQIF